MIQHIEACVRTHPLLCGLGLAASVAVAGVASVIYLASSAISQASEHYDVDPYGRDR